MMCSRACCLVDFTEAIRLNPNLATAYYNRGFAQRQAQKEREVRHLACSKRERGQGGDQQDGPVHAMVFTGTLIRLTAGQMTPGALILPLAEIPFFQAVADRQGEFYCVAGLREVAVYSPFIDGV